MRWPALTFDRRKKENPQARAPAAEAAGDLFKDSRSRNIPNALSKMWRKQKALKAAFRGKKKKRQVKG